MRYTILFLAFVLVAYGSRAQDSLQRTVTGLLIDGLSKKPLEGASITVWRSGAPAQTATLSGTKGAFRLLVKDTGTCQIRISYTGYRESVLALHIGPDFRTWDLGTVALQPGEGVLAEIVIRTDKPLIEQKADRLVYNAEKDLSTLGGTAADVLRNVPMLSVDGDGNVQLRGSSSIRVLINNKPSSIIAVSVADALRQLPADMVKTVEVITSPSAKYDAEGTAGIINIITKKNMLQGVTGSANIVPGNVSTIGNAGLNFRRPKYGFNFSIGTNQFYNTGTTFLDRLSYADGSRFIQDGRTRNRSGFISPRAGFDVSLNDRNSISGGIGYSPSYNRVRNQQVVINRLPGQPDVVTDRLLVNNSKDAGYDINLDYLRTFRDPQKEFSFLTLYSLYNSSNEANQDAFSPAKEITYRQRNLNESQNREATFQADYTQPLKNKTTVEMGAKAILRKASSDVDYREYFPATGGEVSSENLFSYNQDVWAAYLVYAFRAFKKVQVKAGGRYEHTTVSADYRTRSFSFRSGYDNLIPSFNAAYTFREKHTLRLGFTQRLQRPQLYFLNPYREVLAPQVVRQGNPQLDAEVASLFELGYGTYSGKFSLNANVYARLTNNAITSVLSLEQDTTYIRFRNIAQNKTYGFSVSGNVKPFKAWSLNGNANLFFADLEADGLSNSGWMYSLFFSSNIDLGKGWNHGFTGSFNSRRVSLQGRVAAFYYHNTTLRKDILKKRGSIGINLANPLMKGTRVRNHIISNTFEQREDHINFTRGIRLSLTYRFGTLQAKPPRKAKKTINNDDALRGQ